MRTACICSILISSANLLLAGSYAVSVDRSRAITFPPTTGEHLILPAQVLDGDTIRFYFLIEATARLHGINAPESRGATAKEGKASKAALVKILPDVPVKAVFMGKEKYGRSLIILHTEEGESISQLMIDGGWAKPYDGKGPRP